VTYTVLGAVCSALDSVAQSSRETHEAQGSAEPRGADLSTGLAALSQGIRSAMVQQDRYDDARDVLRGKKEEPELVGSVTDLQDCAVRAAAPLWGRFTRPHSETFVIRQNLACRMRHQVANDVYWRLGKKAKKEFLVTVGDSGERVFKVLGHYRKLVLKSRGSLGTDRGKKVCVARFQPSTFAFEIRPVLEEEEDQQHTVTLRREVQEGRWAIHVPGLERGKWTMHHGTIRRLRGMRRETVANYKARLITLHSHYSCTVEAGEDVGLVVMLILCKNMLRSYIGKNRNKIPEYDD